MRTLYPTPRGRIALRLFAASALMAGAVVPPKDPGGAAIPAVESYYMVLYSAQEEGNVPVTSHCFATFARVTRSGDTPAEPRVELHHINWFSVRGHECGSTFGLFECDGRPTRPEPGENRTTRDALELVVSRGRRVTRWGPYEIDRGLYERALRQIDLLEGRVPGRKVLYKALDLGYREGDTIRALNCIHAVSDVIREPAPLRTWTTYGDEAARKVVDHLRPWIKASAVESQEVWHAIWQEIWRDAPAPLPDTLVRAEIGPSPDAVAQAGGTDTTPGSVTLGAATRRYPSQAGRVGDATAAAGGG